MKTLKKIFVYTFSTVGITLTVLLIIGLATQKKTSTLAPVPESSVKTPPPPAPTADASVPVPSTTAKNCEGKADSNAHDWIRDRLKYPETADFGGIFERNPMTVCLDLPVKKSSKKTPKPQWVFGCITKGWVDTMTPMHTTIRYQFTVESKWDAQCDAGQGLVTNLGI